MPDNEQPLIKDTLFSRVNQAQSAADLDAVEQIAISQGYGEDGVLRRTITERRGRFAAPATGGQ